MIATIQNMLLYSKNTFNLSKNTMKTFIMLQMAISSQLK